MRKSSFSLFTLAKAKDDFILCQKSKTSGTHMQEGLQTINAQNILETSNMRHYTSNSSVRHCQFLSYIWFQVIHTQKDGLSWTF